MMHYLPLRSQKFESVHPMLLNRYVYSSSEPINLFDPTRYSPFGEYGGISGETAGLTHAAIEVMPVPSVREAFLMLSLGALAGGSGYVLGLALHNYTVGNNDLLEGFDTIAFISAVVMGAGVNVVDYYLANAFQYKAWAAQYWVLPQTPSAAYTQFLGGLASAGLVGSLLDQFILAVYHAGLASSPEELIAQAMEAATVNLMTAGFTGFIFNNDIPGASESSIKVAQTLNITFSTILTVGGNTYISLIN